MLLLLHLLLGLAGGRLRRLLLGAHELWIVDEAVLAVVVHRQDRIDERQQLVVGEDLLLDAGLRVVVIVLLLFAALLCPCALVRCILGVLVNGLGLVESAFGRPLRCLVSERDT